MTAMDLTLINSFLPFFAKSSRKPKESRAIRGQDNGLVLGADRIDRFAGGCPIGGVEIRVLLQCKSGEVGGPMQGERPVLAQKGDAGRRHEVGH